MFMFLCSVLVSVNWLLTSITFGLCILGTIIFYNVVIQISYISIISSLINVFISVTFTTYYCEMKRKMEFLQLKSNEEMKKELNKVL